jgi:hypothetical protein
MTPPPPQAPSRPPPQSIVVQIGYYTLLVWVFLYFSRLLDLAGAQLKVMMVLNVIWLAAAVLSGGMLAVLTTRVGIAFVGFFCWLLVAFPFSVWRGGSMETVQLTLRALLLMASIIALVRTTDACRRLMYAMGFALAMAAIVSRGFGDQGATGRLALSVGAFSDPNIYCIALLTGLPFLLLRFTIKTGIIPRLIPIAFFIPVLITAVATGSRSGFLALLAMFAVYLYRSSGRTRVYLLAGAAAAVMLVSLVASDYLLARFTTIFSSTYDSSLSVEENRALSAAAVGSAHQRKYLFRRSIELTLKNPIVGVGPGMFAVAEAEDAKEKNIEETWHETHNSYTQVSSETGIPGLIFYLTGLIIAFRTLSRWSKVHPRGPDTRTFYVMRQSAMYLQLSLIVLLTGAMFLSMAYNGLIFVLVGLTVAFDRAGIKEFSGIRSVSVPAPSQNRLAARMRGVPLPVKAAAFPRGDATRRFRPV